MNNNVEQTSPRLLEETPSDQSLVCIEKAQRLLAEAKTIQDVRQVADVAASAETYLRRIKATDKVITQAQEIKARATFIMGNMLAQSPKHPGNQGAIKGRPPSGGHLQTDKFLRHCRTYRGFSTSDWNGSHRTVGASRLGPSPL